MLYSDFYNHNTSQVYNHNTSFKQGVQRNLIGRQGEDDKISDHINIALGREVILERKNGDQTGKI